MTQSNHLQALLKKQFILWRRNKCCSCMEIALPVLLSLLFFTFRKNIKSVDIAEQSYIDNNTYPFIKDLFKGGIMQPSSFNTIPYDGKLIRADMVECINRDDKNKPFMNGHIAMAPKNIYTQGLEKIFTNINYIAKYYDSQEDIDKYVQSDGYNYDICMSIVFTQVDEIKQQYSYQLGYNITGNDIPNPFSDRLITYKKEVIDEHLMKWYRSGFLTIQNMIDNLIYQSLINQKYPRQSQYKPAITPSFTSVKVPAHKKDDLYTILNGKTGSLIVLPLIIVFLRMTYGLLQEKEKKIKEGMKIMGMNDSSFYLSWLIYYEIIYFIISLIVSYILNASVAKNISYGLLFICHHLFCWSLIAQSFFIQVFFTRAQMGNVAAMVFFLLMDLIKSFNLPTSAKAAASLSTQTGFSYVLDLFILVESEGTGLTLSQKIENYSVQTYLVLTIVNILFFLILGLYLDQVFPNEFGKKKHPLFFIKCFFEQKKHNELIYQEIPTNNKNIEEVSAELREKEQQNQVLKTQNLTKIYPDQTKAVDNLTLSMYKDQIFVLLGHNGAGKTSTISMLTGMQEFTEGKASVFDKNVQTEMMEIRKFMGVCPQHDILYDDLTVREHLELFAVFKGMKSELIKDAVDRAIVDVDLYSKENDLVKNLSGGQKRRLSVAIAFIGGSNLIYLDEPTSGMDTSARRDVWEMLKKYKGDKIIVLTTHFMDEADFLGDRIAIMGKGKLICCGSSVFLKNKFGVGYNLTIVKKETTDDSKPIIDTIQRIIASSKILSDVSAEVSFQLPMEEVKYFPQLFDTLDNEKHKLRINSYGISITTMEEVFLRVAELEQEVLLPKRLSLTPDWRHSFVQDQKNQIIDEKKPLLLLDQDQDILKENLIIEQLDDFDLNKVRITNLFSLFYMHFFGIQIYIIIQALILKRIRYFRRDIRGLICEIFLPCVIVVIGLLIIMTPFIRDSPYIILNPELYKNPIKSTINSLTDPDVQSSSLMQKFDMKYWDITEQKVKDYIDWDDKNFVKSGLDNLGSYFMQQSDSTSGIFEYMTEINSQYQCSLPIYINQMNQAIIRNMTGSPEVQIGVTVSPLKNTQLIKNLEGTFSGFAAQMIFSMALSFIPASLIVFSVKEREDQVKHQQLVCGVSLFSYWMSNFFMDFCKHLIPSIFSILMMQVFGIKVFTEESSVYFGTSLLFILYGWSVIPFSYLFGFVFKSYGNAQVASFFLHFILGTVGPLVIFILRIIESTKNIALTLQWILRLFPSFAFGYGILNIGNRNLYALFSGSKTKLGVYDKDIAGGDVIFLAWTGVFYMLMVFLVEKISTMGSFTQYLTNEKMIPYVPKKQDEDVIREMELVEKTPPEEYTVRVNKLRKVYMMENNRHKVAVDQVSFGIKNGEVFTLLGVNGAGKTSTFKILSGEIIQSSGEAHIQGFNLATQQDQARQNIGYCPQFDALLANLTAKEHLELYAAIKGIPGHLVDELVQIKLKEMDLKRYENKLAGTYSGGNKRKLSVAIAMLGNPPIVFLDEPSTGIIYKSTELLGMDPKARRFMWDVISRIATKRKRSSIILTTHSMEEAEALSTKIAIQVEGSIKCIGPIQHIKNKYGNGYEVEIKGTLPTHDKLNELALRTQTNLQDKISKQEVDAILTTSGNVDIIESISENGYGSALFIQLQKNNLKVEQLLEFIIVENNGKKIQDFIQQKLGDFSIIEHFESFYRFKINTDISIGKVFGFFETNKQELEISQYSVRQATLEQIFNMFAKNSDLQPNQVSKLVDENMVESNLSNTSINK